MTDTLRCNESGPCGFICDLIPHTCETPHSFTGLHPETLHPIVIEWPYHYQQMLTAVWN